MPIMRKQKAPKTEFSIRMDNAVKAKMEEIADAHGLSLSAYIELIARAKIASANGKLDDLLSLLQPTPDAPRVDSAESSPPFVERQQAHKKAKS